jgi:toxin ParE1/3/4
MTVGPKEVRIHEAGEIELQISVSFYRQCGGVLLAERFKREVAEGFSTIASAPERFGTVPQLGDVRKFRLKNFPFSILYVNRADYVWVLAIAHGSRRPGYWHERNR